MRREWIEISQLQHLVFLPLSPSMRREWIEISILTQKKKQSLSPSMRREWIEMNSGAWKISITQVPLHAAGVA